MNVKKPIKRKQKKSKTTFKFRTFHKRTATLSSLKLSGEDISKPIIRMIKTKTFLKKIGIIDFERYNEESEIRFKFIANIEFKDIDYVFTFINVKDNQIDKAVEIFHNYFFEVVKKKKCKDFVYVITF